MGTREEKAELRVIIDLIKDNKKAPPGKAPSGVMTETKV
jgi:hypothetical protein